MSTLVFSDSHFNTKFDKKRFNKLADLISKVDKVIINGDFYEGLIINFDEFMNSEWKKLFPLLKSKHAVYIYGNHDPKEISDDRVYEFCDEAVLEYTLKTDLQTFYFTHGQRFLYPKQTDDDKFQANPKFERRMSFIQQSIFFVLGAHAFPKSFNKMTKAERELITPLENMLVCGHSHTPQYNKDMNFIDTGFFNYGYANYLLIDDSGNFELKCEKY